MARYVAGRRPSTRPPLPQPADTQLVLPMVYQGAIGGSATLDSATLTIEAWGWSSSKAKKKASPRVIPIGAILSFDAEIVQSGMRYVQLTLRGHLVVDSPNIDLNSFPAHDDHGREQFLRALELLIKQAEPVEDFEAHLRRDVKPSKHDRPIKDPSFLDWMQS